MTNYIRVMIKVVHPFVSMSALIVALALTEIGVCHFVLGYGNVSKI